MTSFEKDFCGLNGEYWKAEAEKKLRKTKEELESGAITIDEDGVARNKIRRALSSDIAEMVSMITSRIDRKKTSEAYDKECSEAIEGYRNRRQEHGYSEEEIFEMRAAFGAGTTIIDIITGEEIVL